MNDYLILNNESFKLSKILVYWLFNYMKKFGDNSNYQKYFTLNWGEICRIWTYVKQYNFILYLLPKDWKNLVGEVMQRSKANFM
jgi:hypothetical protein